MRPYNFYVELDALRDLINQEHSLDTKYIPARYENIQPVQILFSKFLKGKPFDTKEKREIRLKILSLWVENEVTSTYDLTIYQCSTIVDFLDFDLEGIGERAARFLTDSQAQVEGRGNLSKNEFLSITNKEKVLS